MLSLRQIRVPLSVIALLLIPEAAQAQTPAAPGPSPWPYEDIPIADLPPARPSDVGPRPEPPWAPFGAQGQLVLGGQTNIGVSSTKYDNSAASYLNLSFSPYLDYFVLKNFSLGLSLNLGYSDDQGYGADSSLVETKTSTIALGPRLGWNIPLGKYLSLWLTGTLGVEFIQTTESLPNGGTLSTSSSAGAPSTSKDGLFVSAYAPLLFHVAPHLFVGLGPSVFHEFTSVQGAPSNVGDQQTSLGGGVVVGGYWGGTPVSPAASPQVDSPGRAPAHLGEQGQLLLTSELVAQVASTSYAGTGSSSQSGQLDLGCDYFFADYVSFGGDVTGTFNNSTGFDANGNAVTNSDTSYGFQARFGVAIPLAGPVSLYPRANLGFSWGTTSETSAAGQDVYSFQEIWVSGYVPVVVQVAPHFIAGFGPSVSRDLTSTLTFAQGQASNPGATLGAGFILGGWL